MRYKVVTTFNNLEDAETLRDLIEQEYHREVNIHAVAI